MPARPGKLNGDMIRSKADPMPVVRRSDAERRRAALRASCTDDDLQAIMGSLVSQAIGGDVKAAREVFDRMLGKVAVRIDSGNQGAPTLDALRARVTDIIARDPDALARLLATSAPDVVPRGTSAATGEATDDESA